MRTPLLPLFIAMLGFVGCQHTPTSSTTQVAPGKTEPASPAAQTAQPSAPADPYLAKFRLESAPKQTRLLLQPNDRLAICGDSITEQKRYSRIIETYLAVCVPELNISVRQYGWSGETAPGFLRRMTNDCLRFQPTIATTCYGMNDHGYRPYEPAIGDRYRDATTAIVRAFKNAGTRVLLGSAGCVGSTVRIRTTNAMRDDLNLNLCELRNIDVGIARSENVSFADVFWPMLQADHFALQRYGTNYAVAGKDGIHPDWAGHLVMAYAFLKGLGLDGEIGTFTVDLARNNAQVSSGHELISFGDGTLKITSRRYPFCLGDGALDKDNNLRAGAALLPFNQELNRLMLVAKNPRAKNYRLTWGNETKTFSSEQLAKGINLAEEFGVNPFSEAFNKVDAAVAAKQAYETRQIKQEFHGAAGKEDMEATVMRTERERLPLAAKIVSSFEPVTHTIRIEPVQ